MMRNFLFAAFIGLSFTTFAQKVNVKDDIIYVDDAEFALIEKMGGGKYDYTIKSLDGTALMFWQFQEYNNPKEVNNSNPQGRVTYFSITFYNDKQQCEADPMATKKGIAKYIVDHHLIQNGTINQEAENNFVLIHGKKLDRKQRNAGSTVIIINN